MRYIGGKEEKHRRKVEKHKNKEMQIDRKKGGYIGRTNT
jgi:hypothetical protein